MNKPKKDYREYKLKIYGTVFTFFIAMGSMADSVSAFANTQLHRHNYYEMFYVAKGKLIINNYELNQNSIALVPYNYEHSSTLFDNSQRIVLSFSVNDKGTENTNFTNFLNDELLIIENFAGADAFKRFVTYYCGNYKYKDELIISCFHEIITHIAEYSANKKLDCQRVNTPFISDSEIYRYYIIENYFYEKEFECNLSEIAKLLNLSIKQTQRIIKKIYGKSYNDYIIEQKIEYGKKLLRQTGLAVSQIAEKAGYKSTNSFYSAFKKFTGLTPLEYRKKN